MTFLNVLLVAYHLIAFIWAWATIDAFLQKWAQEKHDKSMLVRWTITPYSLLSASISPECRALRRKMGVATAFFMGPTVILGAYFILSGSSAP
jgi:hypothetical protein